MTITPARPAKRAKPKPAICSYLHFADGNKGGVGKSFLARTLYQWHLDRNVPVIGVEADTNTPDFYRLYSGIMRSRFSENEQEGQAATAILNTAVTSKKNLVVNLRATVHDAFTAWVEETDFITTMADHQIQPVKWFVISGDYDSFMALKVSLDTFGQTFPHVVVKNQRFADWSFYEHCQELHTLMRETRCTIIELPRLNARISSTLLHRNLSFTAARTFTGGWYGVGEQAQVKRYLRLAYQAIESTGYVPL